MKKLFPLLVFCLSLITTVQAQTTIIIESDLDTVVLSSPNCITAIKKYVPPGGINLRPIANAGADFSVALPTTHFQLNGSGSRDPEGSALKYYWRKLSGPSMTISNSSKVIALVTNATAVGTYIFELRVVDNLNAWTGDTVKVTVTSEPIPNQPPIARAGSNQTITLPNNTVNLSAAASTDPDGSITSWLWIKVAGPPANIDNPNASQTGVGGLNTAGTYVFRVTVTDNRGGTDTDDMTVTVNSAPVNQSPIAVAGLDRTITLPTNQTTLNGGMSSDPDGSIASYNWIAIRNTTGVNISSPNSAQTNITFTAAGEYMFQLRVTDNDGLSATDIVIVTVNPSNPQPGQTYTFSFTKNTTFKKRNFSGYEDWNGQNYTSFGGGGFNDKYFRFVWTDIEYTTQGNYNWTRFDNEIRKAINARAKFSFGIFMLNDSDNFLREEFFNGTSARYPLYVHNAMQGESSKDFVRNSQWVPNWNSNFMLTRWEAMLQAVANHINTTSYNGVAYKDVINYVDIRGYGQWGEWHSVSIVNNMSEYPSGTRPTVGTYKRFIDSHIRAFPDYPLVMLLATLDPNRLGHTQTPLEVVDYALKARNNWGLLGIRRDQWGATDGYVHDYLENNNGSYNGGPAFKIAIMERWRFAPWVGEPMGPGSNLSDLTRQVTFYHAASIGNGNYTADATSQNHFRNAEAAAGYRLALQSGQLKTTSSGDFDITMSVENFGNTPCYEKYDLVYELRNSSGQAVWTGTSTWKPLLKLPGTHAVSDHFTVTQNITGLSLVATFKNNYRPMPLFNNGQSSDGSIVLKTFTNQ